MDEFRSGLELANPEELQAITEILFRPKFNPLDYLYTPDPAAVQSCDRADWLDRLDHRFRFLAADGLTVLQRRTQRLTYRQVLIQICARLKLTYDSSLSTADLEAELFLKLMEQTWQKLSERERQQLQRQIRQQIEQSLALSDPAALALTQQVPALKADPVGLLLKGSGALAVSSMLRPWLLQQIARQFALHLARYQVAQQTLKGAAGIAAKVQSRTALQLASRGMVLNAARYSAVRGALAVLGPAMWTWFFADLGWRAISANYARIIPVVFTLAQIRLTRGAHCWEAA
ncbi:MAG: hypothetical protein F6J97_02125 [Leptolyngbya sp. SIO4C1]|nr:hypothetical protein [Leptolyngbya sp. SIO4C1]